MSNPEHLAKLNEGVDGFNRWRKDSPDLVSELSSAALEGLDLRRADLHRANLAGSYLHGTDLGFANLMGANLSRAGLSGTKLNSANLSGANLSRASLFGTDLFGANLDGTDFTEATTLAALFAFVDLGRAKGLESIRHSGPSSIDTHALVKSRGLIPHAFLRGIGVPEALIQYSVSLAAQPKAFHSCFISFSTKDEDFANRLHRDLQNSGVRCWFAPHDIQAGKKIHEQIDEAIRLYDRLLLILSEHSMNSEWVKTEVAHARQKELNEQRQVLFPISLVPFEKIRVWQNFDADSGKDSAREVREYFIPDFSNWKEHDSFQAAFQRLLRDLKAEERGPAAGL